MFSWQFLWTISQSWFNKWLSILNDYLDYSTYLINKIRRRLTFAQSSPHEYEYVAEGAKNIVLRYSGNSLLLKGYVVRLNKSNSKHSQLSQNLLRRYFTEQYLLAPEKVSISRAFLSPIGDMVRDKRPLARLSKKISLDVREGFLIPDVTFKHSSKTTLCIEIKPKCSFLPSGKYLSDETREIKSSISRFQLHQLLKVQRGKWSKRSTYDPLDLYSGNIVRVIKALNALIISPQNNLRVFMNGELSEASVLSPASVSALAKRLIDDEVLNFIRNAQRLDRLDIENVFKAFTMLISSNNLHSLCERYDICRGEDIVDDLDFLILELDRILVSGKDIVLDKEYRAFNCCGDDFLFARLESQELEPLWALFLIRDFLLSATFKDCSLMICTEKSDNFEEAKISLIDFDRKAVHRIPHYYHLDQLLVETYRIGSHLED